MTVKHTSRVLTRRHLRHALEHARRCAVEPQERLEPTEAIAVRDFWQGREKTAERLEAMVNAERGMEA